MTDLSIIIVSYNVRHYLEQCLRSVFLAQGDLEMEVFVVDNASTDDTSQCIPLLFPQVHYIQNSENRGFSRANNQALRLATGRYQLLLNPDTIVTEETLTDCVSYLDQHPEVGATGCAMYGWDGRFAWESRRGVPTPWTSFCKITGLTALFPHSRRLGHYYMRYLDREQANYIEIISGAFMMLRHEALQQVGLLDETFFMYGEDIDLSYRLLQAGWKNAYVPTPILHYKGESTQKSSYRYVHIFYEAMLIFFDKHFSHRYRLIALFIRLAVYLRAALDMLKRLLHRLGRRLRALFPQRPGKPETCLLLATPDHQSQMSSICQDNNFVPRLSHGEGANYMVFDTSEYTYGQMLRQLISQAGQGGRTALGTYNPDTHTIILPYDILR